MIENNKSIQKILTLLDYNLFVVCYMWKLNSTQTSKFEHILFSKTQLKYQNLNTFWHVQTRMHLKFHETFLTSLYIYKMILYPFT
jgi:hypothetical protein